MLLMQALSFTACAYEIPRDFLSELPFESDGSVGDIQEQGKNLLNTFIDSIKSEIGKFFQKGLKILMICGACAVGGVIKKADEDSKGERLIELSGVCLLMMVSVADTKNIILESKDVIEQIGVFSKILMPLLTTWASCAGKPLSAVAITGGATVYINLCCIMADKLIFPLIMVYILLKTAGMTGDNPIAEGIADAMKNGLFFAVKLCLMGVTFYMTLSGCIMSAGDSSVLKTAKAAVSIIPGVGSAVASVTESIVSGAAVIRNAVGVLGVMAIMFFALNSFVKLFVNMVIFKAVSVISTAFTSGLMSKTVDTIANGYAMALGMLAAVSGGVIMAIALCISVFGG